jgi:hypothetical protein
MVDGAKRLTSISRELDRIEPPRGLKDAHELFISGMRNNVEYFERASNAKTVDVELLGSVDVPWRMAPLHKSYAGALLRQQASLQTAKSATTTEQLQAAASDDESYVNPYIAYVTTESLGIEACMHPAEISALTP